MVTVTDTRFVKRNEWTATVSDGRHEFTDTGETRNIAIRKAQRKAIQHNALHPVALDQDDRSDEYDEAYEGRR